MEEEAEKKEEEEEEEDDDDCFGHIWIFKQTPEGTKSAKIDPEKCATCPTGVYAVEAGETYNMTLFMCNKPNQVMKVVATFLKHGTRCGDHRGPCFPDADMRPVLPKNCGWQAMTFNKVIRQEGPVVEFELRFNKVQDCSSARKMYIYSSCEDSQADIDLYFRVV